MEKSWNCVFEFLWEPCMIQIYAVKMGLSIISLRGHRLEFPKYDVLLANSVNPDEMLQSGHH